MRASTRSSAIPSPARSTSASSGRRVRVTTVDGRKRLFTDGGVRIEGDLGQVDPNMCDWIGGASAQRAPNRASAAATDRRRPGRPARRPRGDGRAGARGAARACWATRVDQISDAELVDSIYLTLFPNFHPWGSFNRIVYRFRPERRQPGRVHPRVHVLRAGSATRRTAPGRADPLARSGRRLGGRAASSACSRRSSTRTSYNLPRVQRGLKAMKRPFVIFGDYGESKIRHFHELLEAWIRRP